MQRYPELYEVVDPFLLVFPSLYLVKANYSDVNFILTKQK